MSGSESLYCYAGLTLRVDLCSGEIKKGGHAEVYQGVGGFDGNRHKDPLRRVPILVTPCDPANKIVFGTGPARLGKCGGRPGKDR